MKRLRITVEGKIYEVAVEVLDESGAPVAVPPPMGLTAPATASVTSATTESQVGHQAAGPGVVGSPLAGAIVSVHVQAGQQVVKGDQLLVISAMKMNTYVYAPADGRVSEIFVKPGDTVDEGQALVQLG